MRSVIVKAELDTVQAYENQAVYAKIEGKKNIAYFRLAADDSNIGAVVKQYRADSNVLMIAYKGQGIGLQAYIDANGEDAFEGVYVGWLIDVGANITEEDVMRYSSTAPKGVTCVLKLASEYKGINFLVNTMQKYSNIRYCSGCVFCFDDCRFGCCGKDILTARGLHFDKEDYLREGCSCALPVYTEREVEEFGVLNFGKSKQRATEKGIAITTSTEQRQDIADDDVVAPPPVMPEVAPPVMPAVAPPPVISKGKGKSIKQIKVEDVEEVAPPKTEAVKPQSFSNLFSGGNFGL